MGAHQAVGQRLGAAEAPQDVALRRLQQHAQELVRILLRGGPIAGLSSHAVYVPLLQRCNLQHSGQARHPSYQFTSRLSSRKL